MLKSFSKRFARIQFGGKTLTVSELLNAIGQRYAIPREELENLLSADFDKFISKSLAKKKNKSADRDLIDIPYKLKNVAVQTGALYNDDVIKKEPYIPPSDSSSQSEKSSPETERFSSLSPSVLLSLIRPFRRLNLFAHSNESIPYIDQTSSNRSTPSTLV